MDGERHLLVVLAILILIGLSLLVVAGTIVYANGDGEDEEEEGYGEGDENELAESLGELAWGLGPVLVAAFVVYKYTLPYQARLGLKLPIRFKHILDLHIYSSIVLGIVALAHGYLLLGEARLLEYVIGLVIVFMMVTGILLRWSRDRRVKMFARLIHAQRLLALLLLLLVIIHTSTIED
ncbi:MAG: hypothetical protein GSR85_02930 [Desulfurococcales archaeon]|nr:hypothetical protein [Desulfurococcales archaeon]